MDLNRRHKLTKEETEHVKRLRTADVSIMITIR